MTALPEPDQHSVIQSSKAAAAIREKIDQAGGSLEFAAYMHEALYAPGLGYYTGSARKFGSDGDFVTAPEISDVFGYCIARQVAPVIATAGGNVMEFGAGRGTLAVSVLERLESLGALPDEYLIVEVSPDLAVRQQALIAERLPELASRVRWIDELPDRFRGVMLANEVLDAIPFSRFVIRDGRPRMLRVTHNASGFAYCEDDPSTEQASAIADIETDIHRSLAEGYTSELGLAAAAWTQDIIQRLETGLLLMFDYGVDRRAYYADERQDGWLRCHFRHHAHNDALILPGIQDITAWVDFSAVADAAVSAGASVAGYVTQAHFLMAAGLDEELATLADAPVEEQLRVAAGIRTLTLPGEMGEHIKAIGFIRGDVHAPTALTLMDRTGVL
ncbi:MAG: SAM-dependent methyltransferase [Pseudomonadota bacterium]